MTADAQTVAPTSRQVKQTRSADDKSPLELFPVITLWTLSLNPGLTAPPAFHETLAFFPLEGDQLAAYDLIAGRQLWVARVQTTVEPVVDGRVVVVIEPGFIRALSPDDGQEMWKLPFDETLAVSPVLLGDSLITATQTGDVTARRTADGTVAWQHHMNAAAHARPAAMGNRLFIPTADSRIVALNRETGQPVWERSLGGAGNDILAVNDRLYLGSKDTYFYCINAKTGVVQWRWQTGADVIGRPVIDERTVYFISLDNVLRAMNRSSGVQRWKSPLPLRPVTGPIRSSRTLVVAGADSGLKAYDTKDGKPSGEMTTAGVLSAPPYVFHDASQPFPTLIAVTSDITGRATVTASTRTVEPAMVEVGPLPNAVEVPAGTDPPKDLGRVSPLPGLFQMSLSAEP